MQKFLLLTATLLIATLVFSPLFAQCCGGVEGCPSGHGKKAEKKACDSEKKACSSEKKAACSSEKKAACSSEKKAACSAEKKAACSAKKEAATCSAKKKAACSAEKKAACSAEKKAACSAEKKAGCGGACPGGDSAMCCSSEMKAAQKAWMDFMTPGEHHAKLNVLVGDWNVKSSYWMAPGAPAMESTAKANFSWMLGKRYLLQKYQGSMMGRTFEGVEVLGYNNLTKKYQGLWLDNAGTAMSMSEGNYCEKSKATVLKGSMDCPVTKKTLATRGVCSMTDENNRTFTMYCEGPDGKEYKCLELVYTRVVNQ